MSLESGYTQTITIDRPAGKPDITIVCETWAGGGLEGEESKHRNPVTRKSTARGGTATRTNVTLTRECDAEVWALKADLEDAINRDRATAVRLMVDARGTVVSTADSVSGLLKNVEWPDSNIDSNDVGMVTFEISTDE